MAKLDTVTFAGRSGREYTFRVYPWEHGFKALPAIYVVTERVVEPQQEPSYSPVYIGVTDDLSSIFQAHAENDCFRVYYANTIAVLAEPDAEERERIKDDLLGALDPPCNGENPY